MTQNANPSRHGTGREHKTQVEIDGDLCKGCGICIDFCPKKVFEASDKINPRGYYQPVIANSDKCVGCSLCELLCPDLAIVLLNAEL